LTLDTSVASHQQRSTFLSFLLLTDANKAIVSNIAIHLSLEANIYSWRERYNTLLLL